MAPDGLQGQPGGEDLAWVITDLLDALRDTAPHRLADLVDRAARHLGADSTRMWLVDHQQRALVDLAVGRREPDQAIDGSTAGRAFTTGEMVEVPYDPNGSQLWIPLLEGTDRIGVLEVHVTAPLPDHKVFRHLAAIAATQVITCGRYTDLFTVARRSQPMSLAAELQWQALPPTTFSTELVTVAAMIEPAYEVGGDTFDYAHSKDRLDFAIFDAVATTSDRA